MRKAKVFVKKMHAGYLLDLQNGKYHFHYLDGYKGTPVSLTMPTTNQYYEFDNFPPFFEGLLPEGIALEAFLRKYKLNRDDYFGQLLYLGKDLVGAISVIEEKE